MRTSSSAVNSSILWFDHLSRIQTPLLRLFCFPYAGGSSEAYRSWQRWFPEQVDVCLVHLPGRGKRMSEPAFTQITSSANAVVDRIAAEINVPYALYGHSMGSTIAFEVAREVSRRGYAAPKHLFVSGNRAPQWTRNNPKTFHLPHDEFVAGLKRLNGTPTEVLDNPEIMELFIGLLRADFQAVETYECHPGEPLTCPITVYGGLDDKSVPRESYSAWQEQTVADCKVTMVSGDHFFIRNPEPDFKAEFQKDVLNVLSTLPVQEI